MTRQLQAQSLMATPPHPPMDATLFGRWVIQQQLLCQRRLEAHGL